MNQLIDTHGKGIVTGLLVVVAVLAIMLFGSCGTVTTRGSKQVSDKDLAAFLDVLADPKENVHGVLLIRPVGHDLTRAFGTNLQEAKPCFWDPNSRLTAEKTPVLLPRECVKEGDEIDYGNQQFFVLTPGKRAGKGILFSADFAHRVICTNPLGGC